MATGSDTRGLLFLKFILMIMMVMGREEGVYLCIGVVHVTVGAHGNQKASDSLEPKAM